MKKNEELCLNYYLWSEILFKYGAEKGLILPYEIPLIEKLRNVFYGGIPASIILLATPLCNGNCYDMSLLIAMGMNDFLIVNGDIEDLKLRYGIKHANHSWVESNGWVYDTSLGFKIKKELYYAMKKPVINKVNDSISTLDFFECQEIMRANAETDQNVLRPYFKLFAQLVPKSILPEFLLSEIAIYKQKIGYNDDFESDDQSPFVLF